LETVHGLLLERVNKSTQLLEHILGSLLRALHQCQWFVLVGAAAPTLITAHLVVAVLWPTKTMFL
jgi:hypothetical protein